MELLTKVITVPAVTRTSAAPESVVLPPEVTISPIVNVPGICVPFSFNCTLTCSGTLAPVAGAALVVNVM